MHPWWRVMCLTGVDYFSTLGYQPGIAFLAAGFLSPVATLILVIVTLFGALPVYSRVAAASPNGQGSIAMLEKLFPKWSGKTFVLILLGFATTDFIITITLSAADGAAHFIQNSFVPPVLRSQMGITILILAVLGGIFLKGFKEAINIAVILVVAYLALNFVVTGYALVECFHHLELVSTWKESLFQTHGSVLGMIGVSLLLFPKLALGLSGFETGVSVMPLIKGDTLPQRIHNTRLLLTTAAVIMSIFLMATSLVTTLLIDPAKFKEGGEANGRAMAYLAHAYLGNQFGTVYDVSTILILGFAGASAMAGLLNLIPRYLPRFGMAPEWALASRPLVLVFIGISLAVTLLFNANVDAQGGAYATGVLVLITSGTIAVTLSVWQKPIRWLFVAVSAVFLYTTLLNIYERPEGLKISSFFILAIVGVSLFSRAMRSTELRIESVEFDDITKKLLAEDSDQLIRLVARKPRTETAESLDEVDRCIREMHTLSTEETIYFFEVQLADASEFAVNVKVTGERVGKHCILKARSPVVANTIAAVLLELEKFMGKVPHVYFSWNEGRPVDNMFRFLFLGEGDTAPLTREVLRRAMPDPARRPVVHVS